MSLKEDAIEASPAAEAFTRNTIKVLKRRGYEGDELINTAMQLLSRVGVHPTTAYLRQLAGL